MRRVTTRSAAALLGLACAAAARRPSDRSATFAPAHATAWCTADSAVTVSASRTAAKAVIEAVRATR